mgnify:FL=1
MRTLLSAVLSVVVLAMGGWIYVMYRPGTIVYNFYTRHVAAAEIQREHAPELCGFVVWNMPGALWSTAYILAVDAVSRWTRQTGSRLAWAAVVPAIGVVSELLQFAGVLPGVFDIADLLCYIIPYVIAALFWKLT